MRTSFNSWAGIIFQILDFDLLVHDLWRRHANCKEILRVKVTQVKFVKEKDGNQTFCIVLYRDYFISLITTSIKSEYSNINSHAMLLLFQLNISDI